MNICAIRKKEFGSSHNKDDLELMDVLRAISSPHKVRPNFRSARRVSVVVSDHALAMIASAHLVVLITATSALTLELPQTLDAVFGAITPNVSSGTEVIKLSPIQPITFSLGGSLTNLSLPITAPSDLHYEYSQSYGRPLVVACRNAFNQL